MAYTPELTYKNSCTLRRIAWAEGKPMTTAINDVVERFSKSLSASFVCSRCKDKSKCDDCSFRN